MPLLPGRLRLGFSSFYYLRHLPVDCLKIDGSLIKDLPRSPQDRHMVKAIVELAEPRRADDGGVRRGRGDAQAPARVRVDWVQASTSASPGWPAT